ncbi:MAG: hypothetical protein AAF587_45120, partial [Bacteroidota bacterium]
NSAFQVIRPVDFITDLPIGVSHDDHVNSKKIGEGGKQLIRIWHQRKRYLDKLWTHWRDEYILGLREKGSSFHRNPRSSLQCVPEKGQIVLLADKDTPRGSWKLARITKLLPSSDSRTRSAEIRLPNG